MNGSPRVKRLPCVSPKRIFQGQLRQALVSVQTTYTEAELRSIITAQETRIEHFLVSGLARLPAYIRSQRLLLTREPRVTWIVTNRRDPGSLLRMRDEYVALFEQVHRFPSLQSFFAEHLGVRHAEPDPAPKQETMRAWNTDPQPTRDFDRLLCERAGALLNEVVSSVQVVCHTIGVGTGSRLTTEPYALKVTLSLERNELRDPIAPAAPPLPAVPATSGNGTPPASP